MDRTALVETHISVLIFLGDRVYKLRKPLRTPFLDFSTRELRRADCQREVALNRRLAPDVYLGVLDVVDESGQPIDHLVVMRRLPTERRLSTLIQAPGRGRDDVVQVARAVAVFHSRAERSERIDRAGSPEHLGMLWQTNLDETEQYRGTFLDRAMHARIRARALAFLAGRHRLFERRVADRRIVDGHGDLLAEDVFCLDDGPRILDCVEFDPTFRWGDVLLDTAFLAMDLEHRGRGDLARAFLDAYREFTAEQHPRALEHWYIAYRALVRSKIACLRAASGDPGAATEAAGLLAQADRHARAAEVHLVIVGGLPGSGKSTLARGVTETLGWDLLRSDEVRKDLAGISRISDARAAPFEGLYTPETTSQVYAELLDRARTALESGDSVVLDASWLAPEQRESARLLARETSSVLHELCCVVDLPEARRRIRARAARRADPSDATPDVLDALAARTDVPWPGARRVDTDQPEAQSLAVALDALGGQVEGQVEGLVEGLGDDGPSAG